MTVGSKRHVSGGHRALHAVVIVFALAGNDVVSLALSVMLVKSERRAGLYRHLGIKSAFAVKLLLTENVLYLDLAVSAAHVLYNFTFHDNFPPFFK